MGDLMFIDLLQNKHNNDHRPFRGNVYKTFIKNENGSENPYEVDEQGHIKDTLVSSSDNIYRRNYKKANNINFLDGDIESQMDALGEMKPQKNPKLMKNLL